MNHARILIAAVLLFSGCQDYRLGTFEAPSQECVNPSDWYLDVDGDGFGEAEQGSSCEAPADSVADSTDCDDSSASIYPGATEVCGDGIDSDCDGYGGPEDDEDGDGFTFLEEQELGRDDCDPSFPGPNGDWTNVGRTTPIDDIWDAEFLGIDVGDYSGSAVDVGGDVNGDGYPDMIVGSDSHGTTGAAWLIWGGPNHSDTTILSDPDIVSFLGEEPGDDAGRSVAIGGDVNGDGFADILIGAPDHDGTGIAYLIYGSPNLSGSISLGDPSILRLEGQAYSATGCDVAIGGDVNMDGLDDMLIGAKRDAISMKQGGAAYLVLGSTSLSGPINLSSRADSYFGAEADYDYVGTSVAIGGDVNGDGYGDILIGAPHESSFATGTGAAYLVYGRSTWPYSVDLGGATDAKFIGIDIGTSVGDAVALGGDTNHDGYADILIGAPTYSGPGPGAGAVYLVPGSDQLTGTRSLGDPDILEFVGETNYDSVGERLDISGDINGDGYSDIIIGANSEDHYGFNSGSVYIILDSANRSTGASVSDPDIYKIYGTSSLGHLGSGVATGDINQDGIDDLLVGSDGIDINGTVSGATYLIWGHL